MRTGELARRAGVNIETLRFYERQKLLRAPSRTAGGYRDYREQDLETVCFIKQCQHLGFTLKEIGQLEELHRIFPKSAASGKPKMAEVAKFLRMSKERLSAVDQKIQALQTMRTDLSRLAKKLGKTKGLVCPAPRK
jgi:DNA-binding transcriptional MerR regulator